MINGDLDEFIDRLHYGDEMEFVYRGQRFFVQGWRKNGKFHLFLDRWEPVSEDYIWVGAADTHAETVEDFLNARIWDGRTFLEAEYEMIWQ